MDPWEELSSEESPASPPPDPKGTSQYPLKNCPPCSHPPGPPWMPSNNQLASGHQLAVTHLPLFVPRDMHQEGAQELAWQGDERLFK